MAVLSDYIEKSSQKTIQENVKNTQVNFTLTAADQESFLGNRKCYNLKLRHGYLNISSKRIKHKPFKIPDSPMKKD